MLFFFFPHKDHKQIRQLKKKKKKDFKIEKIFLTPKYKLAQLLLPDHNINTQ